MDENQEGLRLHTLERDLLTGGLGLVVLASPLASRVIPAGAERMTSLLLGLGIGALLGGLLLFRRRAVGALAARTVAERAAITRARGAEQALDESPYGCLSCDADGVVRAANRAAHSMLGRAPGTLPGYHLTDLGLVSENPEAKADARKGQPETVEIDFAHPDGSERLLRLFTIVRPRSHAEPGGRVVWLRDATEGERDHAEVDELRAKLRHNERLETLGTLAGGVAHDFNNLLAPIIGSVELARDGIDPGSQLHEDLDLIESAAQRATLLAQRLLRLSRPQREENEPVSLPAVLHEAVTLLKASHAKHIAVMEQSDRNCPPVLGSKTQLHQVVFNLCKNACHAMPDGGSLTVSVDVVDALATWEARPAADGPFVRVRVQDTGTGMDPETQARIFEPFFTTKGNDGGSGLGLSMVKSIVSGFGGTISVRSALGRGTAFTLLFPVDHAHDGAAVEERRVAVGGHGRVLLVDDDETVLKVTARTLAKLGYEVSSFLSSSEALRAFLENPDDFDVILSDQVMPSPSGTELLSAVRRARSDVAIVLTSGMVDAVPSEALDRLRCQLLPKPASAAQLGEAIARGLRTASTGESVR